MYVDGMFMLMRKYECEKLKMICSRLWCSSMVLSVSRFGCMWWIGIVNGSMWLVLMMWLMMYVFLLWKNSDDSMWIWKFGVVLKWLNLLLIVCIM